MTKSLNRLALNLGPLFAVALMMNACATRTVNTGRHGLLEDDAASASSSSRHPSSDSSQHFVSVPTGSTSADGKAMTELYAVKPGGPVDLSGEWQWPLDHVEISSSYGERSGKFHQGIDLRASMRTPVHAAHDGIVVYVGTKIRGYGRMVVIKHPGNFYTVYAHHSKNLVKMGVHVEKGQTIALSGKSGHSTGPHLHFELRRGTQSYDPEYAFNGYFKTPANRKIASQSHLNHDFED